MKTHSDVKGIQTKTLILKMVKQNCNTIQGLLCITEWRPLLADICNAYFWLGCF